LRAGFVVWRSSVDYAARRARGVPRGRKSGGIFGARRSCLWRIVIWSVTRSPARRQARMLIHVTCYKAASYVTHSKSALESWRGTGMILVIRHRQVEERGPRLLQLPCSAREYRPASGASGLRCASAGCASFVVAARRAGLHGSIWRVLLSNGSLFPISSIRILLCASTPSIRGKSCMR
jgi:hypothetical protein